MEWGAGMTRGVGDWAGMVAENGWRCGAWIKVGMTGFGRRVGRGVA